MSELSTEAGVANPPPRPSEEKNLRILSTVRRIRSYTACKIFLSEVPLTWDRVSWLIRHRTLARCSVSEFASARIHWQQRQSKMLHTKGCRQISLNERWITNIQTTIVQAISQYCCRLSNSFVARSKLRSRRKNNTSTHRTNTVLLVITFSMHSRDETVDIRLGRQSNFTLQSHDVTIEGWSIIPSIQGECGPPWCTSEARLRITWWISISTVVNFSVFLSFLSVSLGFLDNSKFGRVWMEEKFKTRESSMHIYMYGWLLPGRAYCNPLE